MNEAMEIPVLSGILTAMLLIGGAAITLIGCVGTASPAELLRTGPCAHAWNHAWHGLRRARIDDLFFGAGGRRRCS